MTSATAIAPVMRSIRVKATPQKAFRFFTESMGKWWPANFSIGSSPMKDVVMETGVGGRWHEVGQDGSTCQWGEVLAWNPPDRVVLAWRISAGWQFDPSLLTEVDVSFKDLGNGETEVILEHRKLENYGDAAADIVGIFASPDGWNAALARFAGELEAA